MYGEYIDLYCSSYNLWEHSLFYYCSDLISLHMTKIANSKTYQTVILVTCIQEVPGSNLSQDINYLD